MVLPVEYTAVRPSRLHDEHHSTGGSSSRARACGSSTKLVYVAIQQHGAGHVSFIKTKQVEILDFKAPHADEAPAELSRILSVLAINRRLNGRLDASLKKVAFLPIPDSSRLYFLTPAMDVTFDAVIKSPQKFSIDHIRYFMYHFLRGLKYLHSVNVVVGHVSPACFYSNSCEALRFTLTQTLTMKGAAVPRNGLPASSAYLAPEQLVEDHGVVTATTEGDVWGLGCFAVELIVREPLFGDGSLQSAREAIASIFGEEPCSTDQCSNVIRDALQRRSGRELTLDSEFHFIDFLSHCLQPSPKYRWNAERLLGHAFFGTIRDPSDEPSAERAVSWSVPQQGAHESMEGFVDRLHGMILLEVIAMSPEEVYWLEGE